MPELETPAITSFTGPYRWLSNFWLVPITYEGSVYPSVEHAYQAAKTLDAAQREAICRLVRPGDAKKMGRRVTLRTDWSEGKRIAVMSELLEQKFRKSSLLCDKLLATRPASLVEGNWWHDNFWGACTCSRCKSQAKHNYLGACLEGVRQGIPVSALLALIESVTDWITTTTNSTGPG